MDSTIHLHSKLNGRTVSCSASSSANFWATNRAYPSFGGINDCFYPVHKVYELLMLKQQDDDSSSYLDNVFTQAEWIQNENGQVYSITSNDYKDDSSLSNYKVTYSFDLGIECVGDRSFSTSWSYPKYMLCSFQINHDWHTGDDLDSYTGRLIAAFTDAYCDFIVSTYPGSDDGSQWKTRTNTSGIHYPSEYFQITQANCNITITDDTITTEDTYDATTD